MEETEKIIIYTSFDNVIAANIAKTKLDAYGIPCFLTEENFTSLYPLRNDIFPGVRLHVFERDFEQVKEILNDLSGIGA
jgi:Putative prokaryotic signal transducing protein